MEEPYYAATDAIQCGQTFSTNIQNSVTSIFVMVNTTARKAIQETVILKVYITIYLVCLDKMFFLYANSDNWVMNS
jgi:hypothetical protein